jgi:hypothetical protein
LHDPLFGDLNVDFDMGELSSAEMKDGESFGAIELSPSSNSNTSTEASKQVKKAATGVKWTPEEDKALKDAVETHGAKNWKNVIYIYILYITYRYNIYIYIYM